MKTITAISIHRAGESPVFGKETITVRLEDEGGGAFIVLEQEDNKIRLDIEELDEIREAVDIMLGQEGVEE